MDYFVSKYVYQFVSSKGENLIYCSRSNSILKLTKELSLHIEACKIDNLLLTNIDISLLELLKQHKIIIEKEEDNDFLLERQYKEDQITFSNSTIGLVIVPTSSCNFDCPYCFEEGKKSGKMSNDTIDHLIKFIQKHKYAKNISLTWYGGEPLLAFTTIKIILERIKKETNLKITHHSIVTNGYYFKEDVINFFKENTLNNIQITLDGNKVRHNTIRKQKITGEGSYDILIQNMDMILKELPDTHLSVRVNIDKDNTESFIPIHNELTDKWKNKKVSIYPGILRMDNETKTALACSGLSQWESFDLYYKGNPLSWIQVKLNMDYYKGYTDEYQGIDNQSLSNIDTIQTSGYQNYDLYATKLLIKTPLWNGDLNYGGEYSYTETKQTFDVDSNNSTDLKPDNNFAKQNETAAFISYNILFNKISANVGLRYENVGFSYYENNKKIEEQSHTFNNLFPNIDISYSNENIQVMLGYLRSIDRPSYWQLRNSIRYSSVYLYEIGNPYLQPTFTNSFSFLFKWKDFQLSTSYDQERVKLGTEDKKIEEKEEI